MPGRDRWIPTILRATPYALTLATTPLGGLFGVLGFAVQCAVIALVLGWLAGCAYGQQRLVKQFENNLNVYSAWAETALGFEQLPANVRTRLQDRYRHAQTALGELRD